MVIAHTPANILVDMIWSVYLYWLALHSYMRPSTTQPLHHASHHTRLQFGLKQANQGRQCGCNYIWLLMIVKSVHIRVEMTHQSTPIREGTHVPGKEHLSTYLCHEMGYFSPHVPGEGT